MNSRLCDFDFFKSPPFLGFRNANHLERNKKWTWVCKCNYACFYCVTRGEISVACNGKEYTARTGDVIFLKSSDNAVMNCYSEDGNSYYFVSFYYDEATDLMIDTLIKDAGVTSLFKDVRDAHHSASYLGNFKLFSCFIKLTYRLASRTLKTDKSYSDVYPIRAAAEYINLNYDKKISIDTLCRISGYSPAHLRRLFIKQFSLSPKDYILNRRLEAAKDMLLDMPEKSIDEVAEDLGLCSPSYFCKLFKEKVGVTPLEYRGKFG